ncbi:unnamed protein product [Adineta ricciae]|uniref:Uncharacterized protein n=1 Tax=Adineta ricciae TaxID=249248 RepID=A0A814P6A9_ADIRI|nr:unnamed protein product [Adineta ricciae]
MRFVKYYFKRDKLHFSQESSNTMTMFSAVRRFFKFIHWLYLQYLLNTALYMLEPWERALFSTLLVAIISTAIYSAWVFLPHHLHHNSNSKMTKHERQWYQSFTEAIERMYMRFLLVTTLYVMEPWERYLVLTIAFLVITLVTYSAIVFIPFHVANIIRSTVPILTDVLLY